MGILLKELSNTFEYQTTVTHRYGETVFILEKYELRLYDIFIVYEINGNHENMSVTNAMEPVYEHIREYFTTDKPFLVFESYYLVDNEPRVDSVQYWRRGWGPYTVDKLRTLIELGG